MSKAVFCLSDSEVQAGNIVTELKSAAFWNNVISVLFPDKAGTSDFAHEQHTKAPEGTRHRSGTGGILGGGLGWLIGIGSLAIPGVGPFIAAGPIMAALAAQVSAPQSVGLTGALVGMGIPEYRAKRDQGKIKDKHISISVHSENSK